MKISPARSAAFDILLRIEADGAFSSVLLPQYEEKLGQKDRSLCHELVLGNLRRQRYLDRLIDTLAKGKKLDVEVRITLRLGLYQLLFLAKIPQHAAVNESVDLVVRAKRTSARSLVNAVLRTATRGLPQLTFVDEMDRFAVETSHPRWLLERWAAQYGSEAATAIANANNERPTSAFRIIDKDLLADPHWTRSDIVSGAFVVDRIEGKLLDLAHTGSIYFQDEASQLVARCVYVNDCRRFLDVCASPGGKTGLIAALAGEGAKVAAGDLHERRVDLLRANLRRQGAANASVLQYDAEKGLPFCDETFDAILVDAPCTGTGTIRHNPEIRYSLSPDDPKELSSKQQRILQNASKLLKPGGMLVYLTCSLEREEGEDVAVRFLGENDRFVVKKPDVPERFLTVDGFARTWPHRDKVDGFFIASFVKRPV